jgi:hypothetical protein
MGHPRPIDRFCRLWILHTIVLEDNQSNPINGLRDEESFHGQTLLLC